MAHRAELADRFAQVLPHLYALTTADQFPLLVTEVVRRFIGGDKCDFTQIDVVTGDFHILVNPRPPLLDELAEARRAYMPEHPVLAHFIETGRPDARFISDFLRATEFHRTGLYGEFFSLLDVEDQLGCGISILGEANRVGVTIDRDHSGFSEEDRSSLDLLRPHMRTAWLNALRFTDALDHSMTESEESTVPLERLSGRQLEVLEHLSSGCTNIQIANALGISPGTVRKHLENVMRLLDLPTRTAVAVGYLRARQSTPTTAWTAVVGSMFAA